MDALRRLSRIAARRHADTCGGGGVSCASAAATHATIAAATSGSGDPVITMLTAG
jgi:hypothetical protein